LVKNCAFAWSPHGLQGIIFSATYGTIFIDPLDKQHPVLYKSYFKEGQLPADFACSTLQKEEQPTQSRSANPAGDCMLRKYRLAVACTAEYTEYHGGTIADALAALNVTLTRINAIFEKEVAITFELVDNNSEIIFLDPETDPFPDIAPNGFFDDTEIFDEGERIMNERIGVENYDVGHVFITGLGGIAWTSGACMDQYKARGISGLNTPEGPLFDVDIVAHELGHQFGADHSFSGDDGACFRNTSEQHAVEPGSGTTIMSYAGLCERQNVTAQVDPYFHARNLDQIGGHVTNLRNDCATLIPIDNDIPTADAGANYTIPLATPFVLSGEGTDRNADNLTYTWEQMDNGLTIQPPRNTARNGPLFRSLPPSDRPVRYFPDLLDLVNNRTTRWEVLPATGRDLNFRFTVRDNGTLGGCTAEDDVRLTVDGRAGPFRVVEGGFVKWGIEEVQTIEWNVANTTNSNIGADQVDVFLSIDGGLTYPILLANGLPNTGFAEILVPNQPTDQARIMIKGHDHVFFDINNENFIIEPVKNGVLIELPETSQQVCVNQEAVYPIVLGISGVFTGEALLSVKGLPEGVVANFSEATLQPPGTASLTLSNFSDIAAGTYDFDLITQTDQETQERTLQLILFDAAANIVSLQSPANNTGGWINTPTFEWTSLTGDNSYVFQLASSPFFEELIIEVPLSSNSYTLPNALSLANTTRYYWRVQVISDCPSDIPEVFTFTTASIICKAYESTDLPKIISPNGESSAISIITVPDQGTLLDLNIKEVEVEHTWISDVSIGLISPEETVVALVIEPCFGGANLLLSFDDEAPNSYFSIPCPPISGDTYNPVDELSELNGEPITGDWNLILLDRYDDDGGQFQQWSMELCFLDETAIPNLSFFLTKEDASCFNSEDGKAIAMPIDGMGEYTYQWSNGDTTATTEGLSAGTYTVTVSDIDTSLVQTIEITSTDSVEAIYASKEKVCLDAQTGFITLQSDSTNLSFSWNTGATSASLANIEAGVYSVTITNQTGCTLTKEFSIAEEPALQIELTTHDVSCHGGQDGSLEIRLEQDQNLFYQWSGESSNPFDDQLSSGVYGLTITTENGCSESFELIINEPPPLTLATTIQPPNCPGDSAIVDMLPAGGIAPYQIACETPTGDCSFITDSTLLVTIIDANNCLLKEEVKIEVPSEIEVTTALIPIFGIREILPNI